MTSFIPSALADHNRPETFVLNFLRDCPSRATSWEDPPISWKLARCSDLPSLTLLSLGYEIVFYVVLRELNVRNFKGPLVQVFVWLHFLTGISDCLCWFAIWSGAVLRYNTTKFLKCPLVSVGFACNNHNLCWRLINVMQVDHKFLAHAVDISIHHFPVTFAPVWHGLGQHHIRLPNPFTNLAVSV